MFMIKVCVVQCVSYRRAHEAWADWPVVHIQAHKLGHACAITWRKVVNILLASFLTRIGFVRAACKVVEVLTTQFPTRVGYVLVSLATIVITGVCMKACQCIAGGAPDSWALVDACRVCG